MTVGTRIRQLRSDRGFSLVRLAAESRLSRSFLRQVELDRASPTVRSLEQIASVLGVSAADLLVEDDDVALGMAILLLRRRALASGVAVEALVGSHADLDPGIAASAAVMPQREGLVSAASAVLLDLPMDRLPPGWHAERYILHQRPVTQVRVAIVDDVPAADPDDDWHTHPGDAGVALCAVLGGEYETDHSGSPHRLGPGDLAVFTHGDSPILRPIGSAPARALIVSIEVRAGSL